MGVREAQFGIRRRRRRNAVLGQQTSVRQTLPAPTRGLNTRDDLSALDGREAFLMRNWIPTERSVDVREGSSIWTTDPNNMSDYFKSIGTLAAGQTQLICAASEWDNGAGVRAKNILLFENDGSILASVAVSRVDVYMVNFDDKIVCLNGAEGPFSHDGQPGSVFETLEFSGVKEANKFVGMKVHKSRAYYWQEGVMGFWYTQPKAVAGRVTFFPLAKVAARGGEVVSINAWSQDGGDGPDDYLVVTTNRGEVIAYQGSNPSNPADWALVGRFKAGEPVSRHAFLELDGRVWVVARGDVEILPDRFQRLSTRSRIAPTIATAAARYRDHTGWRMRFDPHRQWVIICVPTGSTTATQYVKTPGGWCQLDGWGALDFTVAEGELYFAGNDTAIHRVGGPNDGQVGGGTQQIEVDVKTGYRLLRSAGEKRVAMYRHVLRSGGNVTITTALSFDHSEVYAPSQAITMTPVGSPYTQWGAAWGSSWSVTDHARADWQVGYGTGQVVSQRITGTVNAPLAWAQTDIEVVSGGGY